MRREPTGDGCVNACGDWCFWRRDDDGISASSNVESEANNEFLDLWTDYGVDM